MKGRSLVPDRIRQAREARGMTQSQLAELIGVTRQIISRYEKGEANPSPDNYWSIQSALGFPSSFFIRQPQNSISVSALTFRKRASVPKYVSDMVKTRMEWLSEIHTYLEEFLKFPEVNLPDLRLRLHRDKPLSTEDLEDIARLTREKWGMGLGPVPHLSRIVENNGVLISQVRFEEERVDGCSRWVNGKPFILMGNNKPSAVRQRFSIAHELGHVLLHPWATDDDYKNQIIFRRMEHEANYFAGAFLMPISTFPKEVNLITLSGLQILKPRWKVAIKAMIKRLSNLDLISDSESRSLYKQYSFKGWTRREPLDDEMEVEKPTLLANGIQLLLENTVRTTEMLLEDLPFPRDELEMLTGTKLDDGPEMETVELRRIK